jgi:outer membrane protein
MGLLGNAIAQESDWTLRAGAVGVFWGQSSKVTVAGADMPGAEIDLNNNYTLGFDVGYDLSERWTAHLGFGIPPKVKLSTGGVLDTMAPPLSGRLGEVRYGSALMSGVYKFNTDGGFVPYIGLGVVYMHVFSSKDGDIEGVDVDDAWGGLFQAGFTLPLEGRFSLFFDLRKHFLKAKARGTLPAFGGVPASASIRLNPLITHTGIEYRF